ncbi:MAG: hypothetical protein FJW30_01190 [Acidobacteria bacterium]|nr:hypothetical protein [Acidobacteriota bacterium]
MRWLLFAVSLSASDFTGIWTGQVSTGRNNDTVDIAFQLQQSGARISGKLYGDYSSSRIVEGTIAGKLVTFVVVVPEQAGNEINDTRVRFTGTMLSNGELELTREREASTRAGSGAGAFIRPGSKATFRLKRL